MKNNSLKKFAKNRERFNDILKLRKAKEYDKIFEVYGQSIYKISVPVGYQKKDIKNLIKSGRFEDVYRKYGTGVYNEKIGEMLQKDVYNETGNKPKSVFKRVKNALIHKIAPVVLSSTLLIPPATVVSFDYNMKEIQKENAIEFAKEIEKYDQKISQYTNEIKNLNLTDVEIFMKLMSDMWNNIDGYKTPQKEILGYPRISLETENIGVCRNFADDLTAKLNLINPEYNARNISVYMKSEDYNLANIPRNIIEKNETTANEENENQKNEFDYKQIIGNHLVTAVDIPDENITLILDPTNPSIGVFNNGKIYMFSTEDGKGLETTEIGQLFAWGGINATKDVFGVEIRSFLEGDKDLEKLEKKYGVEAQNEALKFLKNLKLKKEFVEKVDTPLIINQNNIKDDNEKIENKDIER